VCPLLLAAAGGGAVGGRPCSAGGCDYIANKVGPYSIANQLIAQSWGVGTSLAWSAVVWLIAFKLFDMTIRLRVAQDMECEGLHVSSHAGSALHT
jgi:Amt family ammonium transporter